MDRSQYRSIISRVWQAWHSSLWQQAELDYIGNIEALENERLVLNHELHSTKATDKAALEAAAAEISVLLALGGARASLGPSLSEIPHSGKEAWLPDAADAAAMLTLPLPEAIGVPK